MIGKDKKKNKLIIILLVLVLLVVGFLYFNSPKNIFLRVVNRGYNNILDSLDSNIDNNEKNIKTSGNLIFDFKINELYKDSFDTSLFNEINKLELELNSEVSGKTKEFIYELNTKYDSNNLLGLGIYGKEKSLYLELKELFDKYIEIPIDNYDELFEEYNNTLEESEYIVTKFKNSILKNLDGNDFKREKIKLLTDNEEFKVNKLQYKLNEKSFTKLMIKVFKELQKDKKFIKNLASLSEVEEKEITEVIKTLIDDLSNTTEFDTETFISISLYTKGFFNNYVGFEFNVDNELKIDYYKYNDDLYGNLNIENESYTIKSKKQKENSYKTEINLNGIIVDVVSKKENSKYNYLYKLDIEGMTIDGELTFDLSEIEKSEKYNQKFDFSMKFKYENEEIISLSTKYDGSIEINNELFTNITTKDVVNIEELTENDINNIYSSILNNKNIVTFITNIQNALSGENEVNY